MAFSVSFSGCRNSVGLATTNFKFQPESEKIYNIVIGGFGTEAQMSYVSLSLFTNSRIVYNIYGGRQNSP